jgi:D-lactate dehydrogenase
MKRRNNDPESPNNTDKNSIFRILMYSTKEYDKLSFDAKLKELKQPEKYEIIYTHQRLSKDSVKQATGYDCICIFVNDDGSREVLENLKQIGVKLIVLRCAGFNNVDLKAAEELGIEVGYAPSYSPNAVAEHAIALVMSLNRRIHRAYDRVRNGDFRLDGLVGFDMNGKTVGILGKIFSYYKIYVDILFNILGTGRIGQFTIRIFRGFGCRVIAYDLYKIKDEDRNALGFEYMELDDIYAQADIISIHLPLDHKTKHLINAQSIQKMKKGVILVNTARGGLIDTKALIDALKSGHVGGAGLDVYEHEQKYFFNDFSSNIIDDDLLIQLMTYPNVILTAHQAFLTQEALCSIAKTTFENIYSFITNGKPLNAPKN